MNTIVLEEKKFCKIKIDDTQIKRLIELGVVTDAMILKSIERPHGSETAAKKVIRVCKILRENGVDLSSIKFRTTNDPIKLEDIPIPSGKTYEELGLSALYPIELQLKKIKSDINNKASATKEEDLQELIELGLGHIVGGRESQPERLKRILTILNENGVDVKQIKTTYTMDDISLPNNLTLQMLNLERDSSYRIGDSIFAYKKNIIRQILNGEIRRIESKDINLDEPEYQFMFDMGLITDKTIKRFERDENATESLLRILKTLKDNDISIYDKGGNVFDKVANIQLPEGKSFEDYDLEFDSDFKLKFIMQSVRYSIADYLLRREDNPEIEERFSQDIINEFKKYGVYSDEDAEKLRATRSRDKYFYVDEFIDTIKKLKSIGVDVRKGIIQRKDNRCGLASDIELPKGRTLEEIGISPDYPVGRYYYKYKKLCKIFITAEENQDDVPKNISKEHVRILMELGVVSQADIQSYKFQETAVQKFIRIHKALEKAGINTKYDKRIYKSQFQDVTLGEIVGYGNLKKLGLLNENNYMYFRQKSMISSVAVDIICREMGIIGADKKSGYTTKMTEDDIETLRKLGVITEKSIRRREITLKRKNFSGTDLAQAVGDADVELCDECSQLEKQIKTKELPKTK